MPNLGTLNEATVRQRASAESFSRGEDYFQRGAVVGLARRGDQLSAEVEGSEYLPYRVTVTFDAFGVRDAACSCPYDWGGDCKHIVAALLASLRTPEAVEQRAPLAGLLASLDRDQLVALLLRLAETRPDLVDTIEAFAVVPAGGVAGGHPGARARAMPLDGQVYRRQVSAAVHSLRRMRSSDAYRQVGGVVSEVRAVAEQARPFLEAGDGRSALVILEAVTDEYVEIWTELDDSDGYAGEWFGEVDGLWAEALLSADLTPEERASWAQRFAAWARDLSDYGVEDVFLTAEAAAVQGWDDPRLVRILAGEAVEEEPHRPLRVLRDEDLHDDEFDEYVDDENWDEDDEDEDDRVGDGRLFAGDLAPVRLRILERQGRIEEYLRLARAEGQTAAYVTMLVRLDRAEEAVTQGMERLRTPAEALALARALHEHGRIDDALRIGEHGLTLNEVRSGTYFAIGWQADPDAWTEVASLSHQRIELARWLRDAARVTGDADRALAAACVAVQTSGDLVDYREAATIAGERWPEVKSEILNALRQGSPASRIHTVDVLLHEGLIDNAIAIADAVPYHYHLVEQVAAAAIAERPEWVIKAGRAQAESIMDGGKAQHYDTAARWLAKVRDASVAAGRDEEWIDYIESLLDRHRRKYKLMPLLQALR
jgi:uncharacterized Zn finger protein